MTTHPDPASTDTRHCLLEAALFCFAEHGYNATSLRMVAKASGKNMSLIAHHFGSKEGLYVEVFRFIMSHHRRPDAEREIASVPFEAMQRDRALAIRTFKTLITRICGDIHAHLEDKDPKVVAMARLWMYEMPDPRPILQAFFREQTECVTQAFRDCIRALRPDLNDAETLFWCTTISGQCVAHRLMAGFNRLIWGRAYKLFDAEWMAKQLAEFSLRGLEAIPHR